MGKKGVRLYTSLDPKQSCAIGTVGLEGIKAGDLSKYLFDKKKILTTPIVLEQIDGIRVTPNTYTTLSEVDAFCEAMEAVIAKGLPS